MESNLKKNLKIDYYFLSSGVSECSSAFSLSLPSAFLEAKEELISPCALQGTGGQRT